MKIAIVAAGFTATEADQLRQTKHGHFKAKGLGEPVQEKLIRGMVERGLPDGIRAAGFPAAGRFWQLWTDESHAVSFAGLCVGLDQMLLPGCVCLRPAQQPADGFYQPADCD